MTMSTDHLSAIICQHTDIVEPNEIMRDLRQILTRLADVVGQKKTDSWRKKDSDLERQLSKRRIVDVCCAVTLAACACLAF